MAAVEARFGQVAVREGRSLELLSLTIAAETSAPARLHLSKVVSLTWRLASTALSKVQSRNVVCWMRRATASAPEKLQPEMLQSMSDKPLRLKVLKSRSAMTAEESVAGEPSSDDVHSEWRRSVSSMLTVSSYGSMNARSKGSWPSAASRPSGSSTLSRRRAPFQR